MRLRAPDARADPEPERWLGRAIAAARTPESAFSLAFAALALALCIYELMTPGLLEGVYDGDDGVYFGAAVHLVHGVLPYRDFTLLHPPGIALLLAPIALISNLTGTAAGLAMARCLTATVTAANVIVLGRLLAYRGRFAVALGCALLAAFPLAVSADNTLLLEPYLVLFCLLGAVACFSRGELGSRRSLFIGGICFGLAGTVKIWAALPVIALIVLLGAVARRKLSRFVAGVVLGFGVPSIAFIAAAPGAFVRDVVLTQLSRTASPTGALSTTTRLWDLTGFAGIEIVHLRAADAVSVGAVIGALLLVSLLGRGRPALEWYLLCSVGLTVTSFLVAAEFYNHYAYFAAAFVAPLGALGLSRARDAVGRRLRPRRARAMRVVSLVVAIGLIGVVVPGNFTFARSYVEASSLEDPASAIDFYVPAGSCLLAVDVVFALVSNRFDTTQRGCPVMDDSYGSWIALDPGHPPPSAGPYPAALVAEWQKWLASADYFLYEPDNVKVPWTPGLRAWFKQHYLLVGGGQYYEVYVRDRA